MNKTREQLLFGDRNEKLNIAFKTFGKTKKDLDQDVQIIKDWLRTQQHFPEIPNTSICLEEILQKKSFNEFGIEEFLPLSNLFMEPNLQFEVRFSEQKDGTEKGNPLSPFLANMFMSEELLTNMIILNKFSIEKVKQHLDMYYSLRSAIPECFCNKNFKLPHMQLAHDVVSYVPLPKLTKEGYRITVVQLTTDDVNLYDLYDITAAVSHYVEIRMIKDIMLGEISVLDLKNITLSHAGKVTPMMLKKILTTTEKVYKSIVKQVHFINAPGYVEGIMTFIKQFVSQKLSERIHVHRSFETLANHLPLELLPIDFGGPEYTLQELRQLWQEELVANHQRLDQLDHLITDESKRPEPLINDDILGYHGNFKKLNLD